MKIFRHILIAIAILAVLFVGIAYLLPRHITVERTALIQAPTASVYPLVHNLDNWPQWEPWSDYDPEMKSSYHRNEEGLAYRHEWESRTMGNGWLEVKTTQPNQKVEYLLNLNDWGTQSLGIISLADTDGGTQMTWQGIFDMGNTPLRPVDGPAFQQLDRQRLRERHGQNQGSCRKEVSPFDN